MSIRIEITAKDFPTILILLSEVSLILGLVNPIFIATAIFQIVIAAKRI